VGFTLNPTDEVSVLASMELFVVRRMDVFFLLPNDRSKRVGKEGRCELGTWHMQGRGGPALRCAIDRARRSRGKERCPPTPRPSAWRGTAYPSLVDRDRSRLPARPRRVSFLQIDPCQQPWSLTGHRARPGAGVALCGQTVHLFVRP
jgi:hypothetical protein